MNANPNHSSPPPAVRSSAVRSSWWVLGALVLAAAATPVLTAASAPGDWIGAIWLVAVLWTIAASLVQALRAGFRHGDWSAFACEASPGCQALAGHDDDDHDFAMRSGSYAYRRIRDEHEALMREGDRYLEDHQRTDALG